MGRRSDFSILTGSEFLILTHLQMGCDGCVGGRAQSLPAYCLVGLYDAFKQEISPARRQLQRDLD